MKSHEITTQKQRLTRTRLKLLKYSDLEICKSPEQDVFNVTQHVDCTKNTWAHQSFDQHNRGHAKFKSIERTFTFDLLLVKIIARINLNLRPF
jgi:hypothetical protein